MVVALVFAFGYTVPGILLFVVAFAFDVLVVFGQIFPIIRFSDALYLLQYLPNAPGIYQFFFVFAIVYVLVQLVVFKSLKGNAKRHGFLLVVNIAIFLQVFSAIFAERTSGKIYRVEGDRVIDSQVAFGLRVRDTSFYQKFDSEPEALTDAAYEGVTNVWFNDSQGLPEKLLLVVVESWGVTHNENLQASILRPLTSSHSVRVMASGRLSFDGFTVQGELRELCKKNSQHFNLRMVSEGFDGCLPNVLAKQGYESASIHGAIGAMYDRDYWYQKAGFTEMMFFETRTWERRCVSFPGACDVDIAKLLPEFYEGHDKRFVYWLTLNSHSIYDQRDILEDRLACTAHSVEPDTQSCRNFKLQAQFFKALADALNAPEMHGTEVLVVGDHAPPIMNGAEKMKYFKDNQVPWIRLRVHPEQKIASN